MVVTFLCGLERALRHPDFVQCAAAGNQCLRTYVEEPDITLYDWILENANVHRASKPREDFQIVFVRHV